MDNVVINTIMELGPSDSEYQETWNQMLERYKREKEKLLIFWMEHLTDDKKSEMRKLDEEFKEKPAVKCWFDSAGDITKAIGMMRGQGFVQRDLLPLLEYKAKYDCLTKLEKGKKSSKIEERVKWEDAIPKCLREGKLSVAWEKLRQKRILKDDYRLAEGVPPAAANHLVIAFCENCPTLKQNDWKSFSDFWQIANLKDRKGRFAKATEDTINDIFLNL
jgi:hypothetical protein